MDIEKILAFFTQYYSEYILTFFQTLQKPTLRFLPDAPNEPEKDTVLTLDGKPKKNNKKLNPKLISFIILSIFIGSIIQSITPNHPPIRELPTLIIITTTMWLFISSTIFFLFRLLGGKGGFLDTISISLQLIAVIYVVASLFSMILTIFFFTTESDYFVTFMVYMTTQFILLVIYLPLALKELHFSSSKVNTRFVLASAFSILFFLCIVFVFFSALSINLYGL